MIKSIVVHNAVNVNWLHTIVSTYISHLFQAIAFYMATFVKKHLKKHEKILFMHGSTV